MKKFSNRHIYSKYAYASYVNYNNEDVLEYLQEEFLNDNFEILERNNNDVVIMDSSKKEIIISFRGTQQTSDWVEENSRIALLRKGNTQTKRFQTAKHLVQKYKEQYPNYKIVLTGHSMGGMISFTLGQEFDVESHSYDPAISWYNVDRNHNGKYDNNTNKQYIYRPEAGGLVSSLSRLLPKKNDIVVSHENTTKNTDTVVGHHDLKDMYDDRNDDNRHSSLGSHINFLKSVMKDTQSAQLLIGGTLQAPNLVYEGLRSSPSQFSLQILQNKLNLPLKAIKYVQHIFTEAPTIYGSIGKPYDKALREAYAYLADIDNLNTFGWKNFGTELEQGFNKVKQISQQIDNLIINKLNLKESKLLRGLSETGEAISSAADKFVQPLIVADGLIKIEQAKTVHEGITQGILTAANLSAPEIMLPILTLDLIAQRAGLPKDIMEKIFDESAVKPVVQASAVVVKPIVQNLNTAYTQPRHTVLGTVDNKPLGYGDSHKDSWVNRTAQRMVNFFHF